MLPEQIKLEKEIIKLKEKRYYLLEDIAYYENVDEEELDIFDKLLKNELENKISKINERIEMLNYKKQIAS